jgi:nicotinamidase-related amidase
VTYSSEKRGLLILDPYNDFMSEGGKLFDHLKEVAQAVNFEDNMRSIIRASRDAGIKVFIVPHHRARTDRDLSEWRAVNNSQRIANEMQLAAEGTWGGDWHPEFGPRPGDVIAMEHWGQSGFANTDLDQLLKQHGIASVVVVGMAAHTCVESTARFAMELGYHVTLIKDATSAYNPDSMRVAHEVTGPTFAHNITTTAEFVEQINGRELESRVEERGNGLRRLGEPTAERPIGEIDTFGFGQNPSALETGDVEVQSALSLRLPMFV